MQQGSDGSYGRTLSSREALRIRSELALKGMSICECCNGVTPIRDSIVVLNRGRVLTSLCMRPECREKHALLITPIEGGVNVKIVDPDRASAGRVKIVQDGLIPESVLRGLGPKTRRGEL